VTLLQMPSVQVDAVVEEVFDATHATILGTVSEPFDLTSAPGSFGLFADAVLTIITLADPQFADFSEATAEEVAAAINSQWVGGTATAVDGKVNLASDTYGPTSSVQCLDSTPPPPDANTFFGWTYAVNVGTAATEQLAVFNREPAPDERGIGYVQPIYFEVAYIGPSIWPTDLQLTVDGEVAWSSLGGWQNGWTGSVVDVGSTLKQFTATPPTSYTDSATVTVNFASSSLGTDETWSFRALDLTPPLLADVLPLGKQLLRVSFNEPVRMESATGSSDALNPANYVFERQSRPAVEVEAVSVVMVDAYTVDVTTDIELTFGAPYLLLAANIVDTEGNAFLAPDNAITFDAFSPPFPQGRRFRVADFIPNVNKSEDTSQHLRLTLAIVQEVVNLLLSGIDEWADIIDAMLVSLGNPFAEFYLTETDKRRLIRVLVDIYKLKGTAVGIIDVIRFFLGIEVEIDIFNGEGWELGDPSTPDLDVLGPVHAGLVGDELSAPGVEAPTSPASLGPPREGIYTFRIIAPGILTDEERERITSIAEYMKPAHTHLLDVIDDTPPPTIDHLELGLSELGSSAPGGAPGNWILHAPA
jgi:phage tail-like protein